MLQLRAAIRTAFRRRGVLDDKHAPESFLHEFPRQGVPGDGSCGFEVVEARYCSCRLTVGEHFVQTFVNFGQDGGANLGIAVGSSGHGGFLPIHPPTPSLSAVGALDLEK